MFDGDTVIIGQPSICSTHFVCLGDYCHGNFLCSQYVQGSLSLIPNVECETFSFMMSHPAMSLGLRFCMSRKGETWGGGWVYPKGANNMAMSGLSSRKAISGINGLRK